MGVYGGPQREVSIQSASGRSLYSSGVVQDGLILNLDAGKFYSYPKSGTTWTDLSGGGNTGTLTNGPTYSSANGGSIVFDGVDDYINFSTYNQPAYTTTTSFSWNVWIFPTRNSNADLIVGNRGGSELIFTKLTTNNFEYYPISFGGAMPLNVWQNICVIKDQTNFYYYRNSSLIASTTSSITKISRPFYVGGDPGTGVEFFNSSVAQVSVYNRALSASEVSQNFNATRSRYGI
jgi:hypothetical protein